MGTRPNKQLAHPKTFARVAQIEKAIALRMSGETFVEIGKKMNMTKQSAHQMICQAMEERGQHLAKNVDAVRTMELERLDAMTLALWKQKNVPGAAATLLKIMDRRASLLGLDAPSKTAMTDPQGNAAPPEIHVHFPTTAEPTAPATDAD